MGQIREASQVRLHAVGPFGAGIDDPQQMTSNLEQDKATRSRVGVGFEFSHPRQFGRGWQAGLIDEIAPDGSALDAAMAMAERAASLPPVQLRMIKQSINASAFALDRAISHADFDQFALAASSGDYAEGVQSFLERRPPNYTGA